MLSVALLDDKAMKPDAVCHGRVKTMSARASRTSRSPKPRRSAIPRSLLMFSRASVELARHYGFAMQTTRHRLEFECESKVEAESWVSALQDLKHRSCQRPLGIKLRCISETETLSRSVCLSQGTSSSVCSNQRTSRSGCLRRGRRSKSSRIVPVCDE